MKFLKEKIKHLKIRKLNNQGSAIVFVVVIMALMGVLVLTALYMSVSNFYMKANDFQTKSNLYSAEGVLDEIKAGIQQQASAATDIAYMKVMQNYTVFSKDEKARSDEFIYQYITHMRNYYQDSTKSPKDQFYDIEKFKESIQDKVNLITITDNAAGAEISVNGESQMIAYSNALVFKNVLVKYKDNKGYVTIINTDIRVDVPEISFESALTIPEIISYSLIANEKLNVTNGKYTTISGSVYGGRQGIVADGACGMYFKGSDTVITPNLVTSDHEANVVFDENTTLWAGGTVVNEGATLSLLGNSYIEDDTTVEGKFSTLNISGKYMGFGDERTKSEKSSSIIINGVASTVNMTKMQRLLLPGNAFIGMKGNAGDEVGLGESMTAKASQIAYLVPSECIGYVDGKCVLGSNPVLNSKKKSAFDDVSVPNEKKKEVDYSKISNDGTDYEKEYGATFKTKYVPIENGTSAGDSLVYYYIAFTGTDNKLNQANAAKFFKDYFEDNEENIRRYLDIYVKELNVDEDDILRLNVAGNILSKVEATDEDGNVIMEEVEVTDSAGNKTKKMQPVMKYELINETKTADTAAGIDYTTELDSYKSVFSALYSKLSKADPDTAEINNVIEKDAEGKKYIHGGLFENLIDMTVFNYIMQSDETTAKGGIAEFRNDTEGVKALVIDNKDKNAYELNAETPLTTSLLIASGDVIVERNFEGTIIAGGNITLAIGEGVAENNSTVEIDHNRDMVRHVLDIENTFTKSTLSQTENYAPMNLFKTGVMNISSSKTTGTEKSDIVIEDLVTYENWTKQ